MFKKFDEKENVSGVNNVKSSVTKGVRNKLLEQMPSIEPYLEELVPKKEALRIAKCQDHIEVLIDKSNKPTFFRQRDGPLYPTLRLLHKYPFILPHMQVDKGAIKFVLSGANIMCPGLTSPGAKMSKLEEGTVVAIMAEGKQHALAVGLMKMSSEQIFDEKENVSGVNNVKSSVTKGVRNKLLELMPYIEPYLEELVPKKEALRIAKCQDHIEVLIDKSNKPTFFRRRDGPLYPTLRLLHKCNPNPFILPHMQVDKGAIKFVLSGANIMCLGLTSPGAKMSKLEEGTVVAIMAEGKQHALAVGLMKMSSEQILEKNKGVGVDNIHYVGDGLWHMQTVK